MLAKDYAKLFFQVRLNSFTNIFKTSYDIFLQCTFAATCATIVSGAIAERCNFNGYIIFSVIVTGVTYPIGIKKCLSKPNKISEKYSSATHWCWGPNGWLNTLGFYDFAGSGVVHLAGGTCALVGKSKKEKADSCV